MGTQVADVSALAGCSSLHTLNLHRTQVTDVSALAGSKFALPLLNRHGRLLYMYSTAKQSPWWVKLPNKAPGSEFQTQE